MNAISAAAGAAGGQRRAPARSSAGSRCPHVFQAGAGGAPVRPGRPRTLAAALALGLLLGACASPGPRPPAGPAARGEGGTPPQAGSRGGGGYYLDDGPGDGAPVDPAAVPDAVPRAEALLARANRPYEVFGRQYVPMTRLEPYRQRGTASWYGRRYHGNRTSSGEVYDMYAMTAAHPTLPLPSYVRVTHLRNGRSVVVRVNDRGPFLNGRLIDLSWTAASKLGFVQAGSAEVEVELITDFDASGGMLAASSATPTVAGGAPSGLPRAEPDAPLVLTMTPVSGAPGPAPGAGGSAAAGAAAVSTGAAAASAGSSSAGASGSAAGAGSRVGAAPAPAPAPTSAAPERLQVETVVAPPVEVAPRAASNAAAPAGSPGGASANPANPANPAQAQAQAQAQVTGSVQRPPSGVAVPQSGLFLQFAALSSREGAESLRERVSRELGWPLDQLQVQADGGLFKIHAGPFAGREEALAAAERVRRSSPYRPFPVLR